MKDPKVPFEVCVVVGFALLSYFIGCLYPCIG